MGRNALKVGYREQRMASGVKKVRRVNGEKCT